METRKDKNIAIISYLTIFGTLIATVQNSEPKYPLASFHIRQSLGIFLLFFVLGYPVGYFDSWTVTSGLYLFTFIFWLYGFLGALQGEMRSVPVLGPIFQRIFSSL